MIATSALFVVAALVLLILGTFQDGLEMIFASIAASIVAALLLFFGVLVDRRRPAPAGYSYTPPADEPSLTGVGVATQQRDEPTGYELIPEEPITTGVPKTAFDEAPPVLLEEQEEERAQADEEPTEVTGAVTGARRATASSRAAASSAKRKAAPKKSTAKKTTAKKSTAKATTAKTAPKKRTAKKSTAKATTAKKTTAKKTTASKTTASKTTARKTTAKKSTARKTET